VRHADRGSQDLAVRSTARLEAPGIVPPVDSKSDPYDDASVETANGLSKAELFRRRGPWQSAAAVEWATVARVAWWNLRRLRDALGHVPPAEGEQGLGTPTAAA
jgi:transposase InsO family protein